MLDRNGKFDIQIKHKQNKLTEIKAPSQLHTKLTSFRYPTIDGATSLIYKVALAHACVTNGGPFILFLFCSLSPIPFLYPNIIDKGAVWFRTEDVSYTKKKDLQLDDTIKVFVMRIKTLVHSSIVREIGRVLCCTCFFIGLQNTRSERENKPIFFENRTKLYRSPLRSKLSFRKSIKR